MRLRFDRYFSYHRATKMIMSPIFKENMWTWTGTIELGEKELRNATN